MAVIVPYLIQIVIAIAVAVIAYALMPKPKTNTPASVTDLDSPTVDAGRPVPVVFGRKRVKGLNILWWGDKQSFQWTRKM